MSATKNAPSMTGRVITRYCLLLVIYVGLIFVLPASEHSMDIYHLSEIEFKILRFAISLPFLMAWLAAFIGYAKLFEYADAIHNTNEGPYFRRLAVGLAWLAWSLPIPNFTSLLLNGYAVNHPGFQSAAIIITNYTALIMPLVAFTIIGGASRGLTETAKLTFSPTKAQSIIVGFMAGGFLYCYITFQRFDLTSLASTNNPYFLPLWLMVISVVIPYLYSWFVGLLAAHEISLFSRNVRGVLYRQALRLLSSGLIAVVVSAIALQYINSASPRTSYLQLNYKLLLITSFRVLTGVGFVCIALGANRLKKIEEV